MPKDSVTRHTLHVEADPEGLAEVIAEIKRRGYHVECPAFDGRERLKERDELLREAHALMPGPHGWNKSVQLAAEIHDFETRMWPRWSHVDEPPAGCSELRRLLFKARRLSELPQTPRQLYNIVKRNASCDFSERCG